MILRRKALSRLPHCISFLWEINVLKWRVKFVSWFITYLTYLTYMTYLTAIKCWYSVEHQIINQPSHIWMETCMNRTRIADINIYSKYRVVLQSCCSKFSNGTRTVDVIVTSPGSNGILSAEHPWSYWVSI